MKIKLLCLCLSCAAGPVFADVMSVLQLPGGRSDYAQTPNEALLVPTGQMTLEMWVNPTSWRSYGGREEYGLVLFYKGALGEHIDYSFKLEKNGWVCYGTTSQGAWLRRAAVPLNQWTHMAITFNASARRLSLYINGARVGDFDAGGMGAYILPSSCPLYLGGFYQPYAYNNNNFIGRIAEARIWNVERTAAEIADAMGKTLQGNEAGLVAYWNFAEVSGKRTVPDLSGNGHLLTLKGATSTLAEDLPIRNNNMLQVALSSPAAGAGFEARATIPMAATVTNRGTAAVLRVEFYNGTKKIGEDASEPYGMAWSNVVGGVYALKARAVAEGGLTADSPAVAIGVHGPYGGAPTTVPGRVEAEKFDLGGQGLGYNETTPANEGGKYRTAEAVDISADAGASNGYVVGWTKAEEWLSYVLNVASSGTYAVRTRVAGVGPGGQFRILVNGQAAGGALAVPNTGAWTAYQWVTCDGVELPQGVCTMRVAMVANGTSGNVGAFDCFVVEPLPPSSQQPFNPAFAPWPAIVGVEFEDFDHGGNGVAYQDASTANEGGLYRVGEGVDIAAQVEASNGYTVGWTPAGEWLEYTVSTPSNGTYDLEVRVANGGTGATCRLLVDGRDATGPVAIPNTGSWTAYQTVRRSGLQLKEGVSVFRFELLGVSSAANVGAFDRWRLAPAGPLFSISEMSAPPGTGPVLRWGPLTNRFRIHHATSLAEPDWTPVTDWQTGAEYELPLGDMGTTGFYRVESQP